MCYVPSPSPFYRRRNKDTKKLSNLSQVAVFTRWSLCNLVLEFKIPGRRTYVRSSQGPRRRLWRRQSGFIYILFCFVFCRVCLFVVLETDLSASFPFPALLYLKSKVCSSLVRALTFYLHVDLCLYLYLQLIVHTYDDYIYTHTHTYIVATTSEFNSPAQASDSVRSAWKYQATPHAWLWPRSHIIGQPSQCIPHWKIFKLSASLMLHIKPDTKFKSFTYMCFLIHLPHFWNISAVSHHVPLRNRKWLQYVFKNTICRCILVFL